MLHGTQNYCTAHRKPNQQQRLKTRSASAKAATHNSRQTAVCECVQSPLSCDSEESKINLGNEGRGTSEYFHRGWSLPLDCVETFSNQVSRLGRRLTLNSMTQTVLVFVPAHDPATCANNISNERRADSDVRYNVSVITPSNATTLLPTDVD